MFTFVILFALHWIMITAEEYYYRPYNVTRTTLSGIAAYRSALTLDWLAAEDSRQRELAAAFETEAAPPARILTTECIAYPRPATGKVARLMLELLKNLEGDEGNLVPELIQALIRAKMIVETSMLDAEPDLEALVKTPGVMMGEPHTTFPRILAMTWMTITDPATTKRYGWCPINQVTKYLSTTKSIHIAKQMRALEPIIARARYIMEEFIQNVTPLNMYQKNTPQRTQRRQTQQSTRRTMRSRPTRTPAERIPVVPVAHAASTYEPEPEIMQNVIDGNTIIMTSAANFLPFFKIIMAVHFVL